MPVFHLRIFSREANFSFVFGLSSDWIKTKEKFASREKIRKWKTGFRKGKMCAKMWILLVFTSSLIIHLIPAVGDGEGIWCHRNLPPPQEISPLLSKGGRYSYGRLYSFRFAVPDSHSDSNMKIDQVSGE
jgi:hypothetical protein